MLDNKKIGVVIPCFKVISHIDSVIRKMPDFVDIIYIIDDKCPENTGEYVKDNLQDSRISIIFHKDNQGVGGAVISGYKKAIEDKIDIVIKIDGDDQMDPSLIQYFIKPILKENADYTKGNRFFNFSDASDMPKIRLFGNLGLSFLTKLSSGYWAIFDPTNGYTAINKNILFRLPLDKISKRYFFESDILFRLGIAQAKVVDIPMKAVYGDEVSNLKISKIFIPFLKGNLKNFFKRIFYRYFLQDFNVASLELIFGFLFTIFGSVFGLYNWISNYNVTETPTGTIIISALSILIGVYLFLSFLSYDVQSYPKEPISYLLDEEK